MPQVSVREEIVESALVEFHRRGFTACSVEDITRAAGVPKGSFYNHFKSKEDLGAEVVRRYAAASAWRAQPEPGRSPLEQLRAAFMAPRRRRCPSVPPVRNLIPDPTHKTRIIVCKSRVEMGHFGHLQPIFSP